MGGFCLLCSFKLSIVKTDTKIFDILKNTLQNMLFFRGGERESFPLLSPPECPRDPGKTPAATGDPSCGSPNPQSVSQQISEHQCLRSPLTGGRREEGGGSGVGRRAWDLGEAEAGCSQLCGCSPRPMPHPSSLRTYPGVPTSRSLLRFLQEGRGWSAAEGSSGPRSSHITRRDGRRDQRAGGFLGQWEKPPWAHVPLRSSGQTDGLG